MVVHRQSFVGDGVTTLFTLGVRVNPDNFASVLVHVAGLLLSVGYVVGDPGVDLATTVTFGVVPAIGVLIDVVVVG